MVKFRPIGIAPNYNLTCRFHASDFSTKDYKGVSVWNTQRGNETAVVFRAENPSPYPYKVIFGFSEVVFKTLKNAEAFCRERGFSKIKEGAR